jgi:hypothetical protein
MTGMGARPGTGTVPETARKPACPSDTAIRVETTHFRGRSCGKEPQIHVAQGFADAVRRGMIDATLPGQAPSTVRSVEGPESPRKEVRCTLLERIPTWSRIPTPRGRTCPASSFATGPPTWARPMGLASGPSCTASPFRRSPSFPLADGRRWPEHRSVPVFTASCERRLVLCGPPTLFGMRIQPLAKTPR